MKEIISFIIPIVFIHGLAGAQEDLSTEFERSKGTRTPTFFEAINWWQKLDDHSDIVQMKPMGPTDAGIPLHLITVDTKKDFDFSSIRRNNRLIILINNGIHPGEPDGIDASMLLVRDIVNRKIVLPDNIVLAIIPIYNIGGALNRSANYRVDQNGPEEFGFRGNAQNLDLNRDFIKCDSRNARSFTEIFHLTDPDVFVDNHVSNGADYQHVMTLISTQHNKLGGLMGEYLNQQFEPAIYADMKKKNIDLIPYVNAWNTPVENGWSEFLEGPRYASGYAALWQSFAFVPETHMLKPYDQRVKATYELMRSFIEVSAKNASVIRKTREEERKKIIAQQIFPLEWTLDRTRSTPINFKGYESTQVNSKVSGLPRRHYDRTKPYNKQIPFYNYYKPGKEVVKPIAYVIPQGWWKVIDLLRLNNIRMRQIGQDTLIYVEAYRIEKYTSAQRPYEAHHPNSDVSVSSRNIQMKFRRGDYIIPMDQHGNRFIIEVLEPTAADSYFAWNFFDAILGQKEGYSDYAFEDIAAEYLSKHPELAELMEQKRSLDSNFAKSAGQQLFFVYQNSPYYEPDHMRYPVFRVVK